MSASHRVWRVAVLVSGRGSNMEALVRATQTEDFPAEVVLVAADKSDAGGLERAASLGIATASFERGYYASKADHEAAIQAALAAHNVEIVCLAGFMRLLSAGFLAPWQGRILNIHPSLLPKHKGLNTHQRALDAGDAVHGCTVHHVTAGMDEGPVIAQSEITIEPGDTAGSLATRLITVEHALYPKALRQLIEELEAAA